MNISPIEVYFILQLDSIRNAIVALLIIIGLPTVISAVIFFLSFDACFEFDGTVRALTKKLCTMSLSLFFVLFLVQAFIPSTKQMAAVLILPQVVNNEKVQQLPGDILNLVQSLIKEWTVQNSDNTTDRKVVGNL